MTAVTRTAPFEPDFATGHIAIKFGSVDRLLDFMRVLNANEIRDEEGCRLTFAAYPEERGWASVTVTKEWPA